MVNWLECDNNISITLVILVEKVIGWLMISWLKSLELKSPGLKLGVKKSGGWILGLNLGIESWGWILGLKSPGLKLGVESWGWKVPGWNVLQPNLSFILSLGMAETAGPWLWAAIRYLQRQNKWENNDSNSIIIIKSNFIIRETEANWALFVSWHTVQSRPEFLRIPTWVLKPRQYKFTL